jgi:phage repressor protein C with HTH and peptisase S24 domain/DNA-binding XRE family transcriptional regulator
MIEAMGPKIRKHRRRLGLTLDELAGRTNISKPYLSLIETGRVPNPPSDEKLRRLEQTLGFTPNELVTQAHLHRTPKDVRAVLAKLMAAGRDSGVAGITATTVEMKPDGKTGVPLSLDDAYLSGVLQELVDQTSTNVERIATNAVPLINRVSAGYPKDFTDLSYPAKVADEYLGCPDVRDADAFATRVCGDSMSPKYRDGDIVIFSPAASPRNGDDCFVRFEDGQTTFKRVFFESDEASQPVLRLQPRNEKYRPQTIASQKVSGLYKAVYKYQSVDEE